MRRLERNRGCFRIGLDGGESIEARAVIVAAPGPKIAPVLAPLVPEVAGALAAIPFASSATVLLGFRSEDVAHPLDGYGMVVPQTEGLRTTACSFFSTKFPGRAPEGHVLLRGFLGGARDPGVLALSDGELVDLALRDMGPVLGLRGAPVMTRVFRWPGGTPQLEVGHLDRMGEVERRMAAVPGLFLTGSGIRGTGIPDSVADATRVAIRGRRISGGMMNLAVLGLLRRGRAARVPAEPLGPEVGPARAGLPLPLRLEPALAAGAGGGEPGQRVPHRGRPRGHERPRGERRSRGAGAPARPGQPLRGHRWRRWATTATWRCCGSAIPPS